jgi:hypothetical protein
MKSSTLALFIFAFVLNFSEAQTPTTQSQVNVPAPTPYTIVNQDANSRVWQRQEYEAGPNGQTITHIRKYTEICSGLNFLDSSGNYQQSKADILIQPDGSAAALLGQHKAFFPIDISNGRITLVTPDGLQVSSEPLELSYYDGTNTVVLAELTNSIGVLVGNNQVVYPNAFSGLKADIRYTFTLAGLEQDVIIKQQPLTPEFYNLNPASCRIQMVTEFFNSPNPTATTITLPQQAGISLVDQGIGFGTMQMVLGHAFLLGQSAAEPGAMVAKSWLAINGMQFLVEEIPVNAIAEGLAALPLTAMNTGPSKASYLASRRVVLPRHGVERKSTGKIMLAKDHHPATGFCMDYQTINSSLTNVTFQGDSTYFISGATYLYGTTTFEGGSILKYTNNASLSFALANPVINWGGSAYRPVICTAMDDNSVGVVITGSSGSPSGDNYGNPVLDFYNVTSLMTIPNIRISWAANAISVYDADLYILNSQFVNCRQGFSGASGGFYLRNTLFANVLTNLTLGSINVDFQNCTFASNSCVAANNSGTIAFTFTNCIFANIGVFSTNSASLTINGDHNGFYNCTEFGSDVTTNPASPFQTVGAGGYYLASGGNFHNAGTTNIDPTLLASLKQRTTYPPLMYSNKTFITNLVLSPQVPRDTNAAALDIGYHYDVLDYLCGGVCVSNANVTVNPGTAIGGFALDTFNNFSPYSLDVEGGVTFTSQGTATQPNQIAFYNTVQEGLPGTNWAAPNAGPIFLSDFEQGLTMGTAYAFRSTHFSSLAQNVELLALDNNSSENYRDCELYGGIVFGTTTVVTNCLFDRVYALFQPKSNVNPSFCNNLFYGGAFQYTVVAGNTNVSAGIMNNMFYMPNANAGSISMNTSTQPSDVITKANNAWYTLPYTNLTGLVSPTDTVMTNALEFQAGPLGAFYQPASSPALNAGSTTADQLGLYHYTVQTNLIDGLEVPEGTNVVSIGYHYVATDANGIPLDSNGDGIPDYIEDPTGSGILGPQISLITPLNGTYYTEPANIAILATVSDWSSTVTNVEFLKSSTGIVGIVTNPYSYTWPVVAAGTYSVSAIARDLSSLSATSSVVNVTVTNLCGY